MKFFISLVICSLCVNFVLCGENVYKAAVVCTKEFSHPAIIHEAAKSNVDILVLPSTKHDICFNGLYDYDEEIKSIASVAKQAGVYVVAHLMEKTRCQDKDELVRSNLVFDRNGAIVAVYIKPINTEANCTISRAIPTFATDFGTTFALLMEDDLVLRNPGEFKAKNFIVAGSMESEIPFLSGPQFSSSWAFVTGANLVTSSGIFAGKAGLKTGSGNMVVADLEKDGSDQYTSPAITPTKLSTLPEEDLSQYIIRPLNIEASTRGYTDTVCHGKFCCDFYVKTSYVGPQNEVSYGLAAFNGVRHLTRNHHIGAQSCSVFACAGLYKRSCTLGPNNSTNTHFEKIIITGSFTKSNAVQFPTVSSTSDVQKITFDADSIENSKVTITIENGKNLFSFGIFGRVYGKDFEREENITNGIGIITNDIENYYDYFSEEDFQEFFDYVWIRLRVMIFIVSIYFLEMM